MSAVIARTASDGPTFRCTFGRLTGTAGVSHPSFVTTLRPHPCYERLGAWVARCGMVAGCCLAPGCCDSTEPLTADEFHAFVAQRAECASGSDGDCVVAGQGCLAVCGVAVHRRFAGEVDEQAKLHDNPPGSHVGSQCSALCPEMEPVCFVGRCTLAAR